VAAEIERTEWKQLRSYLDKNDRRTFDQKRTKTTIPISTIVGTRYFFHECSQDSMQL
jgi:hypothetical protein